MTRTHFNLELDTEDFTRYQELKNYAYVHEMTLEQAIIALVNSGLSHADRSYV